MKILTRRREIVGENIRVTARCLWEDSDRAPVEIFFEAPVTFAGFLADDASAFAAPAALAASRAGEPRVAIEGSVCPRLRDGIEGAMVLLSTWHGDRTRPKLEPSKSFVAPMPGETPRAAAFLTGGVDSLFLARRNREVFGDASAERFQDAIIVDGIDWDGRLEPGGEASRRILLERRRRAAFALGLEPVAIRTNVRLLDDDLEFFAREFLSASLAAAALTLAPRWSTVTFASAADMAHLGTNHANHPLLDTSWSTAGLTFRHEGIAWARFEKLRALAASPDLVDLIAVCPNPPVGGNLNCGQCEKCLHTMLHLEVLGRLEDCAAFPVRAISAEAIGRISIPSHLAYHWELTLEPLRGRNERAIVAAIEERLEDSRRRRDWLAGRGWKGRLRTLDQRFLGGLLTGLRRRFVTS